MDRVQREEHSMTSINPTTAARVHAVALRLADPGEAHVVRRLAALDDAPELDGRVLLALIDGEAVAALSLRDGRIVANPFVPTQEPVELLRLRAVHVSGRIGRRRPRAVFRPRFT
jgi:hypothetical protein